MSEQQLATAPEDRAGQALAGAAGPGDRAGHQAVLAAARHDPVT